MILCKMFTRHSGKMGAQESTFLRLNDYCESDCWYGSNQSDVDYDVAICGICGGNAAEDFHVSKHMPKLGTVMKQKI